MGEAKRRKQNDPNYGKTSHARKTHKMLKPLRRNELEDLTACLGLLLGKILTDTSNFIGDCEASENWRSELEIQFSSYCAMKESVEQAIDFLEDDK